VVIKLGGAAITVKDSFETLAEGHLAECASLVASAWAGGTSKCVVVHGAGSFGHFQAKEYNIAQGGGLREGGSKAAEGRRGVALVRASVCGLNHAVVNALIKEGVPAIGVPAWPSWTTHARRPVRQDIRPLEDALALGLVPVMHGDVVFDEELLCTVLSGDVLLRVVAEAFKPRVCVFVTDVAGVYDRPPKDACVEGGTPPRLLEELVVHADGSIATGFSANVAAHDVTGGIKSKVDSATAIASLGVPVYIAGVGTEAALQAVTKHGAAGMIPGCSWVHGHDVHDSEAFDFDGTEDALQCIQALVGGLSTEELKPGICAEGAQDGFGGPPTEQPIGEGVSDIDAAIAEADALLARNAGLLRTVGEYTT